MSLFEAIAEPLFLLRLALSFMVGGLWISLCSFVAERWGSTVGGFIGGLPSTIVVALLFIGITQSPQAAAEAASVSPVSCSVNVFYILTFQLTVARGIGLAMISAITVWLLLSLLVIIFPAKLPVTLLIWFATFCFAYYMFEIRYQVNSEPGKLITLTSKQIILRGAFSGLLVALAVFFAKLSGPVVGGVISFFPVLFSSTLVIVYHTRGAQFARAMCKPLILSAMINVVAYGWAVQFLYPRYGLFSGTLAACIVTVITGVLSAQFFKRILT